MKLLIATNNLGKLEEYRQLLADFPLELTTLADEGIVYEPAETGATFEENAVIKAEAFAKLSQLPTLADDSGLEIDALDGAPGTLSARYGGTDRHEEEKRYQIVLQQLAGVPWLQRSARFRCVLVLAVPGKPNRIVEGTVEGFIAESPAGDFGFGYDPVFFLPEYNCTMGQLAPEVKNRISHRGRAIEAAFPLLKQLIETQE